MYSRSDLDTCDLSPAIIFPDECAQVTPQHQVDKGFLPALVQTAGKPDLTAGVFAWCREKACGWGLLEPGAIRARYLGRRRE